jgi:hypothetical protein
MIDHLPDEIGGQSKFNAFLYEPVAEEDNGTPISVLSALTRADHDPWEEAARLAMLSPDRAQRAIVELLSESVSRKMSLADMEAVAKRLVPLLPPRIAGASVASTAAIGADAARQLVYWVMWFGFIMMLVVTQAHDRASLGETGYSPDKRSFSDVAAGPSRDVQADSSQWIINDPKRIATGDRPASE